MKLTPHPDRLSQTLTFPSVVLRDQPSPLTHSYPLLSLLGWYAGLSVSAQSVARCPLYLPCACEVSVFFVVVVDLPLVTGVSAKNSKE